jgi:hypothetical protein
VSIEQAIEYLKESLCNQKQGESYQKYHNAVLNLAIKALEKQIHQKPDYERIDEYAYGVMTAVCPKCKGIVDGIFKDNYCRFCGQKIDWK